MNNAHRIALVRRLMNHAQRNLAQAIQEADQVDDWPLRDADRLDVTGENILENLRRLRGLWQDAFL